MNKTLSLDALVRESSGSKAAAAIRRQGRIPAVMYGHKEEPVSISLDSHDFTEGVHHGHRLMDLSIAGKVQTAIIKDLQYDHLGRDIIHVDLMRVDVTETIKVTVAIELKGVAKGAQEGGIVEAHMDHLEVECLVTNMPASIAVSIKDLDIGQAIHAGDIQLPEGVKLATAPDALVAACHVVAVAKTTEELEAEAPAAPEVIGAEKKETEEEED